MRILFRLILLALAGYGVKSLWDRYGDRVRSLEPVGSEFADTARGAANDVASQAADAGRSVADTARQKADELRAAARDAADEATERMTTTAS